MLRYIISDLIQRKIPDQVSRFHPEVTDPTLRGKLFETHVVSALRRLPVPVFHTGTGDYQLIEPVLRQKIRFGGSFQAQGVDLILVEPGKPLTVSSRGSVTYILGQVKSGRVVRKNQLFRFFEAVEDHRQDGLLIIDDTTTYLPDVKEEGNPIQIGQNDVFILRYSQLPRHK